MKQKSMKLKTGKQGWKLGEGKELQPHQCCFLFLKNKEILTDVTINSFVYWEQY